MKKQWLLKTPDKAVVAHLKEHLKISERLAILLVNRGILDLDEAKLFLSGTLTDLPSPFLMKDMKKAVDRIIRAIKKKEKIVVYGDYDVDGVTSTAALLTFFREIGIDIDFHIPHRLKEGYGLHTEALKQIRAKGGEVVITADCGISNVKEAEVASDLGIDLIITDHHIVPPELPGAHAVLNPLRADSDYPDLHLAGVGVVFHLMLALRATLREEGFFKTLREPNLKNYLDFVALGTIADMVPLRGVNHILVKEGLQVLSKRRRVGLKALMEVSGTQKEEIGTYDVGFKLAPRLNAGGRISEAEIGVKLLISTDFLSALDLAQTLDRKNSERRFLQQEIFSQAVAQVEKEEWGKKSVLVLSSPHWHPGVIGIVASKLVEKYWRPAVLIAEGDEICKGSCRSIEGLHMVDALRSCKDLFENFGGHKAAAGFSIRKENIIEFKRRLEATVSQTLSKNDFIPKVYADLKIDLTEVDEALIEELEQLAPYGMGNAEPLLVSAGFKVIRPTVVGEKHLKIWLDHPSVMLEAIGFYMGEWVHDATKMTEVVYTPAINEWHGKSSIQLKLKNFS